MKRTLVFLLAVLMLLAASCAVAPDAGGEKVSLTALLSLT